MAGDAPAVAPPASVVLAHDGGAAPLGGPPNRHRFRCQRTPSQPRGQMTVQERQSDDPYLTYGFICPFRLDVAWQRQAGRQGVGTAPTAGKDSIWLFRTDPRLNATAGLTA